jgi:hypothetical protein
VFFLPVAWQQDADPLRGLSENGCWTKDDIFAVVRRKKPLPNVFSSGIIAVEEAFA